MSGFRCQVSGKPGAIRRPAFCIARLLDGILCSVRLHPSLQKNGRNGYSLCLKRFLLAGLLPSSAARAFASWAASVREFYTGCLSLLLPSSAPSCICLENAVMCGGDEGPSFARLGRAGRPSRSSPVGILLGARFLNALLACCWRVARSRPRRRTYHDYEPSSRTIRIDSRERR